MKQLSLTSIICGTVIVLAPIIHNLALMAMLTHLLALDPTNTINLHGSLNDSYQGWCLFIGISLFIAGIVSGFSTRAQIEKPAVVSAPHPLAAESNA